MCACVCVRYLYLSRIDTMASMNQVCEDYYNENEYVCNPILKLAPLHFYCCRISLPLPVIFDAQLVCHYILLCMSFSKVHGILLLEFYRWYHTFATKRLNIF